MSVTDTQRISRWARWALLLTAAAVGAALVLTAWSSHASVREASRTLARGQGEALLDDVRDDLRAIDGRPDAGDLLTIIERYSDRGLRYLGIAAPNPVEAGDLAGAPLDDLRRGGRPGKPLAIEEVGTRIRIVAHPLAPPGRRPPPDGARHRPPRHLPPLVLELEPIVANLLVGRARRTALISTLAAVVLLLAAAVAFRWLRTRERLDRQLARERHLATLGEMSAVLAHEIRNPLASLKGHAQLLAESLPEDEARRAKAQRVVDEAVRLESLTSGLLEFVRTGEIHRIEANPATVLQSAVDDVDAERVEVDAAAAPATWSLDPARLRQALANLLRNAVQASPNGQPVRARAWRERDILHYEVHDAGDGIAPGQESKIFEAFHTNRVHGTGLGLAVAKRVVELHGGDIEASNHASGGAVFHISIPG
jgi:two-component system sensor histidine kinase HydH